MLGAVHAMCSADHIRLLKLPVHADFSLVRLLVGLASVGGCLFGFAPRTHLVALSGGVSSWGKSSSATRGAPHPAHCSAIYI